jgi:hypothetical protein
MVDPHYLVHAVPKAELDLAKLRRSDGKSPAEVPTEPVRSGFGGDDPSPRCSRLVT